MQIKQCGSCEERFSELTKDNECPFCHSGNWVEGEIDGNSCDKCFLIYDTPDLIWLSTEDFTPKEGEVLPDNHGYDALCERCYQSILLTN